MTPTLERALAIVSGAKMETRENGSLVLFLDDSNDSSLVSKVVEMYGYKSDPSEVANANTLYFVECANLDDDEDGIEEDLEEEDSEGEESDDSEDDDEDEEEDSESPGLSTTGIDDDGRALRVLSSAEAHRFAQKIYQGMLGNDNMGGYAAFLQDFDRFLLTHKGKGDIAFGGKRKEEASAETIEQRICVNFLDLMENATLGELPWATPNADDAIVIAAVETAKKKQKNGRAGLLSALMKAISGDAGDAAVKAWDDKNSEKLHEILTDAVKKVSGQAGRE